MRNIARELVEYFLIYVFFIRYSRLQQLQLISDGNFAIFTYIGNLLQTIKCVNLKETVQIIHNFSTCEINYGRLIRFKSLSIKSITLMANKYVFKLYFKQHKIRY